jgi:hypothetical protein
MPSGFPCVDATTAYDFLGMDPIFARFPTSEQIVDTIMHLRSWWFHDRRQEHADRHLLELSKTFSGSTAHLKICRIHPRKALDDFEIAQEISPDLFGNLGCFLSKIVAFAPPSARL